MVVAGSVGKTSTKLAIARLLSTAKRVRYQEGNYNDRLTVPMVVFGHSQPGLYNLPAYFKIYQANKKAISSSYPFDVLVLELGTEAPGQIEKFAYLKPDVAVVTAVTPEHMESFKTLDKVAEEELLVVDFADQSLINIDDVPAKYIGDKLYLSYGQDKEAHFKLAKMGSKGLEGQDIELELGKMGSLAASTAVLGVAGAKLVLAAAAVGSLMGLTKAQIKDGLKQLKPAAGRMQVLPGLKDSWILDDTYNASPAAALVALDVLYQTKASQRIAILGNMNEMGEYSRKAHEEVGKYCDPKKLDLVVTIGPDANRYLAKAAEQQGCQVETATDPYLAAELVRHRAEPGAIILAKGSQNGVFAEEAVKHLLADPEDAKKLVRQSEYWQSVKRKQFDRPAVAD